MVQVNTVPPVMMYEMSGYGSGMGNVACSQSQSIDAWEQHASNEDFGQWLQETFGHEQQDRGSSSAVATSSEPMQLLSPRGGNLMMNPDYVAKVVNKLDMRIAKLQEIKERILFQAGPSQYSLNPPKQPSIDAYKTDSDESSAGAGSSHSKKRKLSLDMSCSTSTNDCTTDSDGGSSACADADAGAGVTEEYNINQHVVRKVQTRRDQNRVSAQKSRLKKKHTTDQLQKYLENLKAENKKLQEFISTKLGSSEHVQSIIQHRVDSSKEKEVVASATVLVKALQNPANRMLSPDAASFLGTLRDSLTASAS